MEPESKSAEEVFGLQLYEQLRAEEHPVLDNLGSGDSCLILDVLDDALQSHAFAELRNEVVWNVMLHKGGEVPRLVSIQGTLINNCEPLYRHPADEQPVLVPWTPMAAVLKDVVQDSLRRKLGLPIELNHALIQYYRDGHDYISEHSDKTLDITKNSVIVNLSLGATRVMVLQTKDKTQPRRKQKISLPHNSLFVLGWDTNKEWTHAIKQDRRIASQKREDELRDDSQRISITFRSVSTFLNRTSNHVFGQGAPHKTDVCTEEEDSSQTNTDANEEDEVVRMLHAFSSENKQADFDWDQHYGAGFSVLNFKTLNPTDEARK